MRRAYHKISILNNDSNQATVFSLGYDSCAEHEWGINPLLRAFGVKGTEWRAGVDGRRVFTKPKMLRLVKGRGWTAITCTDRFSFNLSDSDLREDLKKMSIHKLCKQQEIVSHWDSYRFMIASAQKDYREALMDLWDAFLSNDVAIGLGCTGPFRNSGGLVFTIISRLDSDIKKEIEEADLDARRLTQTSKATGIHEILEKAGKKYFTLSPRWLKELNDADEANSNHPVVYWLNPFDQINNNSGWFTVEDLELWAKEQGPVVKGKAE